MPANTKNISHAAEASALGFYYQTFFALLTLLETRTDDAAIAVEQLDDVVLKTDDQTLLFQLKHSVRDAPPAITLKSRELWRSLRVWIDALPRLTLSETTFHLVTVASIPQSSSLAVLTSRDADRTDLAKALENEARDVADARARAKREKKELPYSDRADGCDAFLGLADADRRNLLRRIFIRQGSPTTGQIEEELATHLNLMPPDQRPAIAKRLVEWWDRQVVYSLCGKRDRILSRSELQTQLSCIIGELEQNRLSVDFEGVTEPADYQPNGILARQIHLVEGKTSDLAKAIREEWRAREQRSKWIDERPSMAAVIGDYDRVLQEYWSDRHCQMVEDCANVSDKKKCVAGLGLLRWTHDVAPSVVRPIADRWNAPYYVRGSYQVLAINLDVGWHPDYAQLLRGDK